MLLKRILTYISTIPLIGYLIERLQASPIGYRLAKGVFWSMAGALISRGMMLAATVLVARMLGKTVYGELGMIQSTVSMFGVFAGFGLSLTATKHVAEYRQSDPNRAGRIIGLSGLIALITGLAMALGLFFFAPWLAEHTIDAPHLANLLRISALILFINALNGAQIGALAGFEAFKTIAYVNFFVGLISFPILVGGAYLGGLVGVVWALVANLGVNWLLNHYALRKVTSRFNVPFKFKNCSRELSVLWEFSLPATLSGVLVGPIRWICNAFLVNQPEGYSEMGIFTAALVFQNLIVYACSMLHQPLLSMLSNVGASTSQSLETANILSSWIFGLILAIPLLCIPEAVEMLFGGNYSGYTFRAAFSIVLFYTCILTYRNGLIRVLVSKNLLWWGFYNNFSWALVLLPTAFFLTKWGAIGLALSFAIAYTTTSLLFVPVYMSRGKVPRDLLISKEAAIVWLIIITLVCTVLFNVPLMYRAIMLPFAIYLAAWALIRVWKRNAGNTSFINSELNGKRNNHE